MLIIKRMNLINLHLWTYPYLPCAVYPHVYLFHNMRPNGDPWQGRLAYAGPEGGGGRGRRMKGQMSSACTFIM